MNFANKDHLARYMIAGHVHLSKKDYGFFNNVVLQIQGNKQITSNQNTLFDKLLSKYKRQLTRLNNNVDDLIKLEWKLGIIESKKEFLDAKIFIVGNDLVIKSPFNSHFVQNFRRLEINPFVWDSVTKSYKCKVSTYSLKIAYTYLTKYYKDVVMCDTTTEMLKEIELYQSAKIWQPTLVKINNYFYIVASNNSLMESISEIDLNDDPKTLFALSAYGITIDSSVVGNDPVKNFASNRKLTFDLDNLDYVIEMLKLLEVDNVFTSRDIVYNKSVSNEIKLKTLEHGITLLPHNHLKETESVLFTTNSSGTYDRKIAKVIHLTNSRPVKIT